jgi:hypothetical protein
MKNNFKKFVSCSKYEEALKLILEYDFVSIYPKIGSWERKAIKEKKFSI